jgi:hypothetical protein
MGFGDWRRTNYSILPCGWSERSGRRIHQLTLIKLTVNYSRVAKMRTTHVQQPHKTFRRNLAVIFPDLRHQRVEQELQINASIVWLHITTTLSSAHICNFHWTLVPSTASQLHAWAINKLFSATPLRQTEETIVGLVLGFLASSAIRGTLTDTVADECSTFLGAIHHWELRLTFAYSYKIASSKIKLFTLLNFRIWLWFIIRYKK